ncbi:MAG: electron transfer flavoprotein subunit beta/FixA family protein [Acidobacteriota bacterium]
MNILVFVKHVPDTETRVKVAPDGLRLDLSEANWVMSPYDEYAVEEALKLKEKLGGEVTAITAGNEESVKTLRTALAMGADKAVLCADGAFEGGDAAGTARVLAAAARKIPFDLILAGKHGVGDDNQQVGSLAAQLLGIPAVTVVTGLEVNGQDLVCKREIEGGTEVVAATTPALITCQKGLNEPRYPSLKGIMAAKKKEVATWKAADLGLDPGSVGAAGAAFEVRKLELPPPRPAGKVLSGELPDQVKELVRLLREEAKAI